MSANDETIYLKIGQNALVHDRNVVLSDIASVTCSNEAMLRKVKQKKIHTFQDASNPRAIFSILRIVELIHEDYPNAEIENEGEADFIIEYEKDPDSGKGIALLKTAILCVLIFFGAAFTIMAFNNDIGVTELFGKFYYQVMGKKSSGMTELEISYCIGIAAGILLFFNRFGRKKITPDPTPLQVEMRKYEQDADMAYIENAGRGGKERDVH